MIQDDLIFEKFKNTVYSKHLIENVDVIIVALSGGSDSVSMLLLLSKLREEVKSFELTALHFNHEIRGEEANRDEEFSKSLCEKLGVPFYGRRGDVPKYSVENKISLEEAARILRYDALNTLCDEFEKEGKTARIAVAHNRDDKAETVLFNILRGTSVDGLHGIRYQNEKIIRPILDLSKEETYKVCKERDVSWQTDSTNLRADCTRNKIRLEIMPLLSKEMGVDVTEKLLSLSSIGERDSSYLTLISEEEYKKIIVSENPISIDIEKLKKLHDAIKSRVVLQFVKNAHIGENIPYKGGNGVSATLVRRIIDFLEGDDKGTIELGKKLFLTKVGGTGVFGEKPEIKPCSVEINETVVKLEPLPQCVTFAKGEKKISVNFCEVDLEKVKKGLINEVFFDEDILLKDYQGILKLRGPLSEDRFFPYGGTGSKKLPRFLIDKKIPKEERSGLILLCGGEKILHVFGVGRSKFAPITENTKKVIRVSFIEE